MEVALRMLSSSWKKPTRFEEQKGEAKGNSLNKKHLLHLPSTENIEISLRFPEAIEHAKWERWDEMFEIFDIYPGAERFVAVV